MNMQSLLDAAEQVLDAPNQQRKAESARRAMGLPEEEEHLVDYILDEVCGMFYGKDNEDKARRIFIEARWPDGPMCPRCTGPVFWMEKYGKFHCFDDRCKYQFTPKAQTRFHGSRLPFSQIVGGGLLWAYHTAGRNRYSQGSMEGVMTGIFTADEPMEDNDPEARIWHGYLARYPMSWPTAHRLFTLYTWDEWDQWWKEE